MLLVQNIFVRKTLYIFTSEIFQKRSHLSFCLSTDISVLNFLETPSVQPLITLASDSYSARCQSLIFWKTNKEPTENPGPFSSLTCSAEWCWGAVKSFGRHCKCFLRFERAVDIQAVSECVSDKYEFLLPHLCLPLCLWGGSWTLLFLSSNSQALVRTLMSAAASSLIDSICLEVEPAGWQLWGDVRLLNLSVRHEWHSGPGNSLFGGTVLCIVGCLAACLASTH